MQVFVTTPLALVLGTFLVALGPRRGIWALFAALPFGASAAFGLAGVATLSLALFCALCLWLALMGRGPGPGRIAPVLRPGRPGFALGLLLVWAAWGSIALPVIFSGQTQVLVLVEGAQGLSMQLAPLAPSASNATQLMRLALGAGVFVILAAVFHRTPDHRAVRAAVICATGLMAVLVAVDMASHALHTPGLLDPLRTMKQLMLSDQRVHDLRRVVGGFAEPAALGAFSVGLYGFWLRLALGRRPWLLAWVFMVLTGLIVLRTTSAAAFAAMSVVTFWALARGLGAGRHARWGATSVALVLACLPVILASAVVAYTHIPLAPRLWDALVVSKLDSASALERAAWTQQALLNFVQTWGFGAGIGSVRASGWLASCLGGLGLMGTALYLWFLAGVFWPKAARRPAQVVTGDLDSALRMGCAAILLQAVLTRPYPDLDLLFFAMAGLATGLTQAQTGAMHEARSVIATDGIRPKVPGPEGRPRFVPRAQARGP